MQEENQKIIENFKEEGVLTVETLDIASSNATSHAHAHHAKKKITLTTPLAIIIAGIMISFAIIAYGFITKDSSSNPGTLMFLGKQLETNEYIYGKEDSDVLVIEYSDTECPYCVQVSPTIKKIKEEYKDRVAFVYRHFPLTQIHPHALDEARAISCAGVVGGKDMYFKYIDTLFDYKMSKQTTKLPTTGKEDFARTLGINFSEFTKCMQSNQTEKTVISSINDGVTAGVQGTPSTFVLIKTRKGYEIVSMVDGARPYEFFKAVIDEALAR